MSLAKVPSQRIEHEFGVAFPGEILPPEQWTQTALKRLPGMGQLNWAELFGRQASVVLDLGCGNGRSTIAHAIAHPDQDHLGLDVLPVVIRYATRRANQRGLENVRFAVGDAKDFLARLTPPGSVHEIHLYHPQPYYDIAMVHRRLITPEFLALVHRALGPGGLFVIQTDNPGYWRYVKEIVPIFFEFEERMTPWPDAPKGKTRREIIALKHGLEIYRGAGHARRDLDFGQAMRLAEGMPLPVFDADRRLREVDGME